MIVIHSRVIMLGVLCITFSRTPFQCKKLHGESSEGTAPWDHSGPAQEHSGSFPGIPDADIGSALYNLTAPVNPLRPNASVRAQELKNMGRKRGKHG